MRIQNRPNLIGTLITEEAKMKDSILTKSLLVVAAMLVVSASAVAYPGSNLDLPVNVVKVSYDDLNLSQEGGAHTLYIRLQRASKQACGVENFNVVGSARVVADMKHCYREALAASVKRIGSSQLTKLHNS
jgi:UrcA family protein